MFAYLALSLSFLLNIPALVYRKKTELFTPIFSIFASHLICAFAIMTLVLDAQLQIWEALTAAAILLLLAMECYNHVYKEPVSDIAGFPLQNGENEKALIDNFGFQYIVDNTRKNIAVNFGEAQEGYLTKFNQYCKKMQWDWTLDNIPVDDENLNTLGEICKNSYHKIHALTNEICGSNYFKPTF